MKRRAELIIALVLLLTAITALVHCEGRRAPVHSQGVDAAQPETRP